MALIAFKECCAILNLSHGVVKNIMSQKGFPKTKRIESVNGKRYWDEDEVRRFAKTYAKPVRDKNGPLSLLDNHLASAFLRGSYDRNSLCLQYKKKRWLAGQSLKPVKRIRLQELDVQSQSNPWAGLI